MKKTLKRLNFVIIVLFTITISFPVLAGVEPSPFYDIILRINEIEDNLLSINKNLEKQLKRIIKSDKYALSELDTLAEEVCILQDQLNNIMYELPMDKTIPEIKYELIDVELVALQIVNRIDKLFIDRDNIDIGPGRVKDNSQIITYISRTYTSPANTKCKPEPAVVIREHSLSTTFVVGDKTIEVDEDGFICDPSDWNEEVALALAETEDIEEVTEEHWKVMQYLRDYYQEFGVAPMIRKLCKETGFKLKKIYDLFPSGPAKGACKVAGLPKPTGCI